MSAQDIEDRLSHPQGIVEMGDFTKYLLITANIGSLFEEPSIERIQETWFTEIFKLVSSYQPSFFCIHCQEVGGKKSENNRELVHQFVRALFDREEISDFTTCIAYLDEDYKSEEQYTALGSFYFVKSGLDAEQWNYHASQFKPISQEKKIITVTENASTVQKYKYPLNCFPKKRWSRKGFMVTRWKVNGRTFNLVNIHLVHDVSNVKALLKSPSKYSQYRKESLKYTLNQLNNKETNHCIIFGDFNTRLDTKLFVENHLKEANVQPLHNDGEKKPHSIVVKSVDNNDHELLRVSARKFDLHHWRYFSDEHISKLLDLDKELEWCHSDWKELEIAFLPTYPHSEDPKQDAVFSDTRCPAWCDRILFDGNTFNEFSKDRFPVKYDCIGKSVCIGDHKPVFLSFQLPPLEDVDTLASLPETKW